MQEYGHEILQVAKFEQYACFDLGVAVIGAGSGVGDTRRPHVTTKSRSQLALQTSFPILCYSSLHRSMLHS